MYRPANGQFDAGAYISAIFLPQEETENLAPLCQMSQRSLHPACWKRRVCSTSQIWPREPAYGRRQITWLLTTFPFFVHDLFGNGTPTTSQNSVTSVPQTSVWFRGPCTICAGAVTHTNRTAHYKFHIIKPTVYSGAAKASQ